MKMNLWTVWSGLAVVAMLLAACAPAAAPAPTPKPAPAPTVAPAAPAPAPKPALVEPRRGGVLTLAISSDLATFDPHTHNVAIIGHTALASYSNLVWHDPKDETYQAIIGDLATRWEMSPDGTAYTFYLRKDAKFHDGQPVTAADVKFSLERIAFPPKGQNSPRKDDLFALKSVAAPDDYTVKTTLNYPSASFLGFVAGPWISVVPKRLLEKEGNDALLKKSLGSGPFVFKEYIRGVSYEVVRNPNYYKPGVPYLDGIKAFVVKDSHARLSALRTGQVMMLRPGSGAISPVEIEVLRKEMGDKVLARAWYRDGSMYAFTLNNEWKPFSDARVRRALAMGMNKQGLFDTVFQGLGQISGPMPADSPWALPKAELQTYPGHEPDMTARIARAKELLAEAGYTKDKPLEFEVSTRSDVGYFVGGLEYVATELRKFDAVKAKAVPTENAAWYAQRAKHAYQALVGHHSASTGDPDSIIGGFYTTGGGYNLALSSDAKVDELFNKQARELDPQKRKELVWELQRILLREAYWPVFGQIPMGGAWVTKVKGNIESSTSYHNAKYEDVWLAQ